MYWQYGQCVVPWGGVEIYDHSEGSTDLLRTFIVVCAYTCEA